MQVIKIMLLIIIWAIPIAFFSIGYLRMDKKEQDKFKSELKQPRAFLNVGLSIIGLLFFFTGLISSIKLLQYIGVIMVFINWFMTSIINFKKVGLIKGIALISMGIIGVVIYSYFI